MGNFEDKKEIIKIVSEAIEKVTDSKYKISELIDGTKIYKYIKDGYVYKRSFNLSGEYFKGEDELEKGGKTIFKLSYFGKFETNYDKFKEIYRRLVKNLNLEILDDIKNNTYREFLKDDEYQYYREINKNGKRIEGRESGYYKDYTIYNIFFKGEFLS